MFVNEAIDYFLMDLEANGSSQRNIGTYRQRLGKMSDQLPDRVEDVSFRDLSAWVVALRRQSARYVGHDYRETVAGGLSGATIQGMVQAARTFWRWAEARGLVDQSPAAHLKRPTYDPMARDKAIGLEDVQKLRQTAVELSKLENWLLVRDGALWLFAMDTAARAGEVCSVEVCSCGALEPERVEGGLAFSAAVVGKSGAAHVYYTLPTAQAIARYIAVRPNSHYNELWLSKSHTPLTTGALYQAFQRLAGRAGVARSNPQALRHTNGLHYTTAGNLALAQRKLRHKDPATTALFYSQQNDDRVKSATCRLSVLGDDDS